MEAVVQDYKAGLITMQEANRRIKEIATQMEMIENGQKTIDIDKEV